MTKADKINELLRSGATVVVSTYTKATQYTAKHAGWFFMGKDGELHVRHGRRSCCLSMGKGERLLVSIKAYR